MNLTFFSNIPNSHNEAFFAALRAKGVGVRAVYKHQPSEEGRGWKIQLGPDDVIADSRAAEAREWRAAADTDVVLTGSYATGTDVLRRLALSGRARSVHVWGERLKVNGSTAVRWARRAYFAPVRLDGIFAVGSRATASYRSVTGRDMGVHAFHYPTDRGLAVDALPADQPTIGYAGRLVPYKGVDVVLRGLAVLAATERPALEIAGSGPEERALRALASDLGIGDQVDWLGDLDFDALDARRARWWAQVVPARASEGWGMAVPEALNTGVPVVASGCVHAAADLVKSGRNGVIVDAGETDACETSPDEWAGALRQVIDPATHPLLAENARVTGTAFGPDPSADWFIDVVTEAGRARAGLGTRSLGRSFVDATWADLRLAKAP